MAIFISFDSFDIGYFIQPCKVPCSMQHAVSTPSTYPGSCKSCFSSIPVFGGKISLIFSIIYQIVDQHIAFWSLPTIPWMSLWGLLFQFHGQLALKFHWDKTCFFRPFRHINYIEIIRSVMPKPVYLLTVQEAHKEYSSLTDQIRAKYMQLDSDEFGSPGTPAFDAEACELANLLACVSQLCQRLNLPMPKELYGPTFFKHWRHFSDQNLHRQAVLVRVWRMQLCSHRYVRITGLLSAP